MSKELHGIIVAQIQQARNATFHLMQSNRVSVWLVSVDKQFIPNGVKDKLIPIVYDKVRKELVTALPECCIDVNQIGFYEY